MVNTMIKKAVKIITAITLLILFQPAHATAKPVILYTDILSGPNTGGENNNGTYLSIFGKGFGPDRASVNGKVTINGTEVAVYKQWGAQSKVYDSHGIQVITVQSGPSVTSGPIVVAVNGEQSNNNHVFTVIPGNIIFVALNGNDANDGSFTSPKLNANSAANGMQAGDHLVLRGGTWQQPENNGGFIAFKSVDPGTSSAPIAVMGYPGEDVFLDGNNGTARIKWHSNHGSYSTWANLRMVNGGFHQATQSSPYATNIRIVNVKTGEWHKTGGGSGNIIGPVTNYSILGNEIHDIGDNKLYHGIYLSVQDIDLTDIEIGWNHFNDINWCETGIQNDPSASTNQCAGNAIQFYDGGSGPPYTRNVSIHDNVIHDVSKNGIALGSHSSTGYKVYNNLVYRTGQNYQGGIKFGYQDLEAEAYNNILYDNNIGFDFTGATSVVLKNNIVIATSGQDLTTQSGGFDWPSIIDDSHNIFFGGTTPLWADGAGTLNTDPILLDPSNDNFHLQSGSPAIDAGADVSSVVTKDFDGNPRPMDGDNNGTYLTDIGAYEYNGTYVPQCSDGSDNDGDGLIDYPNDPGCLSSTDYSEFNDITPPDTTASPSGGTYTSSQSVTLSPNEAATTYYTTDGTSPTTSSSVYSTPILITQDTTLKFFSIDTTRNQETINTEIYTITSQDTTPSIRTNGQPTGTLTAGITITTLSLTTDESATCRYSTTSGVNYSSMTNTFSSTGGTSHSTNVSGLQDGQAYTYYVRCQDTASNPNTNDYTISFSIALPSVDSDEIIIDNTDSEFTTTNSWWQSSYAYPFGSNSLASDINEGSTASWTPNITQSGLYDVYAWWTAGNGRINDAKYTINHAQGSTVVTVNQKQNGGMWNLLGTFNFNLGSSGNVTITDESTDPNFIPNTISDSVCADAIKFLFVPDMPDSDNSPPAPPTGFGFYVIQ